MTVSKITCRPAHEVVILYNFVTLILDVTSYLYSIVIKIDVIEDLDVRSTVLYRYDMCARFYIDNNFDDVYVLREVNNFDDV